MSVLVVRSRMTPHTQLGIACRKLVHRSQSAFQKIEVYDSVDFGRILLLDEAIHLADADEHVVHEMLAHVALFSHPNPESVLILGGGDGCAAREAVKHDCVKEVTLVEMDPDVPQICGRLFSHLSPALDHPLVRQVTGDVMAWLPASGRTFDVILVDSQDFAPYQTGGLFGAPVLTDCLAALSPDGILDARVGDLRFDAHIVKSVFSNLEEVFPVCRMFQAPVPSRTSAPYCFAFCSRNLHPQGHAGIHRFTPAFFTRYYHPDIHDAAFVLPREITELSWQEG
ncbi:MAG: hypothetical protein ABIJ95_05595 [Pseudomonadota bacterium]